jgi:hypothetical protein
MVVLYLQRNPFSVNTLHANSADCERLGQRAAVANFRRPPPPGEDVKRKKTDVIEHHEIFNHVGVFFDEVPGSAGLPVI